MTYEDAKNYKVELEAIYGKDFGIMQIENDLYGVFDIETNEQMA